MKRIKKKIKIIRKRKNIKKVVNIINLEEGVEVKIKAEVEIGVEVGTKINREVQDLENLVLVVDLKEDRNILNLINKINKNILILYI